MQTRCAFLCSLAFSLAVLSVPVLAQTNASVTPDSNNSPQNAPIPQTLTLIPPKNGIGVIHLNQAGYQPGQPVGIDFTISNTTHSTVDYDYPTTQEFDVTVSNAQGAQVWDWAHGQAFAPHLVHLALKPGEKKTYHVVWDGHDAKGRVVPPGLYTINARMTSNDRPAVTGSLIIDPDTDPDNIGVPTRSPAENGAVRNVFTKPPLTASATVAIGVPVPKHP